MIVTDNGQNLYSWLKFIDSIKYNIPPYHSQLNGIAGRNVPTVKLGLNVFPPLNESIEVYL